MLRLHAFLPFSRANGPGSRAVIWVQGCSLGCPACFNPKTHSFQGGQVILVDELVQRLVELRDQVQGVTISGGEPLQQPVALLALLANIRQRTPLSVLLFSGYTWDEIQHIPQAKKILGYVDVLIAGRYQHSLRLANNLVGSSNQSVHFLSGRYHSSNLQNIPPGEVIISPDGEVTLSGVDPLII
jgi:anaerobic ribonucleoside-triphosphate reductase activating protein